MKISVLGVNGSVGAPSCSGYNSLLTKAEPASHLRSLLVSQANRCFYHNELNSGESQMSPDCSY